MRNRPRRRRGPGHRRFPRILFGLAVLGGLAWLAGWLIDGVVFGGDEVARGVSLAGRDVGGMSKADARRAVEELAVTASGIVVTVNADDQSVTAHASEIGLGVDVEATVERVLDAGGGTNPIDWLRGVLGGSDDVEPVWAVDGARAAAAVADLAPVAPGGAPPLDVVDGLVVVINEGPNLAVDLDALSARLVAAATLKAPVEVEASLVEVDPSTHAGRAAELAELANVVSEAGITVTLGDQRARLDKGDLRPLFRLVKSGDDLSLALDPVSTTELLSASFPTVEQSGTDATFVVGFGQVAIEGGEPDIRCCDPETVTRLQRALVDGESDVAVASLETPRERGREWAESLGISEMVSSFTTNFPAGQPRVRNIERIAELTRGVIIPAGETFSVNEFVGRRTIENGFVNAPVIENGVFAEDVGGGVSQFATTLFNAAFFAGLDFGEYQSHSIYIQRYPYGREATLSFPHPDLQIENHTPHAILIWPTTTATSVTVELYSTSYAPGTQTNQTQETQGTVCTKVRTERTRTYPDGHTEVDHVTALYRPEGLRCDGTATVTTAAPPSTAPPPVTVPPTAPPSTAPPPTAPPATAPPVTESTTLPGV